MSNHLWVKSKNKNSKQSGDRRKHSDFAIRVMPALKQDKFIILQFWRPEVQDGSHWGKIKASAGLRSFQGRISFLTLELLEATCISQLVASPCIHWPLLSPYKATRTRAPGLALGPFGGPGLLSTALTSPADLKANPHSGIWVPSCLSPIFLPRLSTVKAGRPRQEGPKTALKCLLKIPWTLREKWFRDLKNILTAQSSRGGRLKFKMFANHTHGSIYTRQVLSPTSLQDISENAAGNPLGKQTVSYCPSVSLSLFFF